MKPFNWQWNKYKIFNWIFQTHIQCPSPAVSASEEKVPQNALKLFHRSKNCTISGFLRVVLRARRNFLFSLHTTCGRSENYVTIKRKKYRYLLSKIFGRPPFPGRDPFSVTPPNSCLNILYLPYRLLVLLHAILWPQKANNRHLNKCVKENLKLYKTKQIKTTVPSARCVLTPS